MSDSLPPEFAGGLLHLFSGGEKRKERGGGGGGGGGWLGEHLQRALGLKCELCSKWPGWLSLVET